MDTMSLAAAMVAARQAEMAAAVQAKVLKMNHAANAQLVRMLEEAGDRLAATTAWPAPGTAGNLDLLA